MCVSQHKTELRWITVGLWVLAACAGRSTRSKGSQQTLRTLSKTRVPKTWSTRTPCIWDRLQPPDPTPRTGPEGPGSLESAGRAPDPPSTSRGFGVLLSPYCLTAERSIAGLGHHRPCIPGGFTLPHHPDGTLGRGPRSEPRPPMQMVSGALGSFGFGV